MSESKATPSHTMELFFSETKTESSKQESVTVDNKTVLVNGVGLKVGLSVSAAGPWVVLALSRLSYLIWIESL